MGSHPVSIVIFGLVCIGFIVFIWRLRLNLSTKTSLSLLYFTLLASPGLIRCCAALGLPTDNALGGP